MRTLIVTTSPRKSFSTSKYFATLLKGFMIGEKVEILQLKTIKDYKLLLEQLEGADNLVFATPVYVDTIPSTTLEYLEKLEKHLASKKQPLKVYAITNCGFYEGEQCEMALNTYEFWCQRAGVTWCGGIGIGSGVMLGFVRCLPFIGLGMSIVEFLIAVLLKGGEGFIPFSFIIQTGLWLLFSLGAFYRLITLAQAIRKQKAYGKRFGTVWFCPRFLFVIMASLYWMGRALVLHGVFPWQLFKEAQEDDRGQTLK